MNTYTVGYWMSMTDRGEKSPCLAIWRVKEGVYKWDDLSYFVTVQAETEALAVKMGQRMRLEELREVA